MKLLAAAEVLEIAAAANQAPSVRNTQPTRWRLADDGALWLITETTRQLSVGDASGRDLRISLGAALEATAIVLAERGLGFSALNYFDYPAAARVELASGVAGDRLIVQMPHRMTWRKTFAAAAVENTQALAAWSDRHTDITRIDRSEIGFISRLHERTSLAFYRNAPYRQELLHWMRLSRSDPRFGLDGLSAPALGLSAIEALAAGQALRDPLFNLLDSAKLIGPTMSEHSRTLSVSAILLFHRPIEENPIDTGRALYRRLLELTAHGFQTWPISVLADDQDTAGELMARYGIADDRRLITVWRTGMAPSGAGRRRERLPAQALIKP